MNFLTSILDKIEGVKRKDLDVIDVYMELWQHTFDISPEQYDDLVSKIKEISPDTVQTKARLSFTDTIKFIFYPNLGDSNKSAWESYHLFEQCGDRCGMGIALGPIALNYKNVGLFEQALETIQLAVNYLGNNSYYNYFIGVSYYQEGDIHLALKDFPAAIQVFNKGMEVVGDTQKPIAARLMSSMALVHIETNQFDLAEELFIKALNYIDSRSGQLEESKIYTDLGKLYLKKQDFDKAIYYHGKSIEIRSKLNHRHSLITNYIELSKVYILKNNIHEALGYALKAKASSIELNLKIKLFPSYQILSEIHERLGEMKLALDFYKKYQEIKENVLSFDSARTIKQISVSYEIEKVEKEKELYKLKNVVLKTAIAEIEASVRYAKRLQEAILPSEGFLNEHLPNHFIFYQPKDIVAGDFYWAEKLDDIFFIAAADSTGHGVPGAMVSVVCSNALNRAIKEFKLKETGKILEKTRELVLETFEKSSSDVKDGMDISLLSIDLKNKNICWSGANNPLWFIQNGELKEIKPDKQPIGKTERPKPFKTHSIPYQENTIFYLFTDGLADQFGGPKSKKFKYNQLSEHLLQNHRFSLQHQGEAIRKSFVDWKGELEQIDDVCVMGIKL